MSLHDDRTKNTDIAKQVARFERVRKAHQTEVMEDYIELIADLIDTIGEARVVDIAERLGVKNATVTKTLLRLQREKLITSQPYRSIFLTDDGRNLAERIRQRHKIVLTFLCVIGIRPEVAAIDAEGIEHHVSDDTLYVFERIIKNRKIRGAKVVR